MTLVLELDPEVESALILKALHTDVPVKDIAAGLLSRVLTDEA